MLHFNTIGSVFVASAGVLEPVGSAGAEEFEHPASTPKSKVRQVAIANPFFINTPLINDRKRIFRIFACVFDSKGIFLVSR